MTRTSSTAAAEAGRQGVRAGESSTRKDGRPTRWRGLLPGFAQTAGLHCRGSTRPPWGGLTLFKIKLS